MFNKVDAWETLSVCLIEDYLLTWLEAFSIFCKARNLTEGIIHYYRKNLKQFCEFCDRRLIKTFMDITPHLIREYKLVLEEKGNNPGG